MILVDANVLMYAAGTNHPNKKPSITLLERVAEETIDAALDAEVLQEVLHRYRAIARWGEGRQVYESARKVFSIVLPITAGTLDQARSLLDEHDAISARDALHAAVVLINGLDGLCSYDQGFDQVAAIRRISPDDLQ